MFIYASRAVRRFALLAAAVAGCTLPAHARSQSEGDVAMMQPPAVASGKYDLDKSHASLTVRISHLGFTNYTFRFDRLDADLDINAANPEKSKLSAGVDMTSISTGDQKFDTKLEGEEWLNAVKFPAATFTSTQIERTGANTARITGDLTFMGVTKPMVLDARLNAAGPNYAGKPTLGFSARGAFRRSDFGLTTYLPKIGDTISLELEVEFTKK